MWFKVDDSFADHPKLEPLWDDPEAFTAAVALWTIAGCYCSRSLTDGFVADGRLQRLLPRGAKRAAECLVSCGLWERKEGGYSFHDWADYQPPAEAVRRKRAADKERKAKQSRGNNGSFRAESNATPRGIQRDSAEIPGGLHAESEARSRRPVPVPVPVPVPDLMVPSEPTEAAASAPLPEPGPSIAELESRYPPGMALDLRDACALTRRSGKMADSAWLAILRRLEKHPVDAVREAGRIYLERYADGEKGEAYLLGMVRRQARGGVSPGGAARARRSSEFVESDLEEVFSDAG